jgi:hypothetical protein
MSQSKVHNKKTLHSHLNYYSEREKQKPCEGAFLQKDMAALLVAVQITHSHIYKLRDNELSKNIPVDTAYER